MKCAKSVQALRNGASARLLAVAIAALAAAQWPTAASAALLISSGTTRHMHCAAGKCTATRDTAVLNVSDLESMLAAGDVKVSTGAGSFAKTNDISVKAELAWGTASRLTLYAFRSILISQPIDVQGTGGGLTLTTNDGVSGNTMLRFFPAGHVAFTDYVGGHLFIDGKRYTLVNDVDSLAAEIANNNVGFFALASSRDAAIDHGGSYGTSPIPGPFAGIFEGLGNTISNLQIDDATDGEHVGLFANKSGGVLRDISLVNADIIASGVGSYVGTLVGRDTGGAIAGAYSTGGVTGGTNSSGGGLEGYSDAAMSNCHAAVTVTAGSGSIGGLIGGMQIGSINNCQASGKVTVTGAGAFSAVGGLAGTASSIADSWASGNVQANDANEQVGGLVGGTNGGSIENSYATGDVSANAAIAVRAGGLVGDEGGTALSSVFETGNVKAVAHGVVFGQGATVYAGGLTSSLGAGQICDELTGAIVCNGYALGDVFGKAAHDLGGNATAVVGGLIGDVGGVVVEDSYSIGKPTGSTPCYTGGSIGLGHGNNPITMDVYWDTTSSGTTVGYGSCSDSGSVTAVGLTTTQLQSGLPAGFDPSIWTEDGNGVINGGYPYLINNPPR